MNPALLPSTERLIGIGVRVAILVAITLVLLRLAFALVNRIERFIIQAGDHSHHAEQRANTLGSIMRSLATTIIATVALIEGLQLMGLNVAPLLAGAGVLGVALGFGAQTMVRDLIAGMFVLAENQFAVGEIIEVSGRPATVEKITIRTTTLRDLDGYVHFVPNGELRIVTNRSRGWNRVAVDVVLNERQDVDRALEACREVAQSFSDDPDWAGRLLEPVQVWGVESIGLNEVRLRVSTRTSAEGGAAEVARALRLRLLHGLARARVGGDVRTQPTAVSGPVPAATAGGSPPERIGDSIGKEAG